MRSDHPLRRVAALIDFEFVRKEVAHCYGSKGNVSVRRRQHLMERSFADAANNHHFKRARWRRLWRHQIQDYLIAAIQNVRILLAHSGEKRTAAALRVLPPEPSGRRDGLLPRKNTSRSSWNCAEAIFFLCTPFKPRDPIRA